MKPVTYDFDVITDAPPPHQTHAVARRSPRSQRRTRMRRANEGRPRRRNGMNAARCGRPDHSAVTGVFVRRTPSPAA